MTQDKEFGKVTAEQLLLLLQWLPHVDSMLEELQTSFAEDPGRFDRLLPNGLRWSAVYELPMEEHLARLALAIGLAEQLQALAGCLDPQQAVLDDLAVDTADEDLEVAPEYSSRYAIGLWVALMYSFESVQLYGRYLNEFVAMARAGGPGADDALCKAVRVDPSVICGPTGASRLSRALVTGEEGFLKELRVAMEGKSGNQAFYLRKFRYAMKMLAEGEGLGDSPTALARRLVELEIYQDGPTAVKNATELIRRSKETNNI
jgi:hypothetical protein